jgi:hypothetical protein
MPCYRRVSAFPFCFPAIQYKQRGDGILAGTNTKVVSFKYLSFLVCYYSICWLGSVVGGDQARSWIVHATKVFIVT